MKKLVCLLLCLAALLGLCACGADASAPALIPRETDTRPLVLGAEAQFIPEEALPGAAEPESSALAVGDLIYDEDNVRLRITALTAESITFELENGGAFYAGYFCGTLCFNDTADLRIELDLGVPPKETASASAPLDGLAELGIDRVTSCSAEWGDLTFEGGWYPYAQNCIPAFRMETDP